MKRIIFILLFFLLFISIQGQSDPYDTDPTKYEVPIDSTQFYAVYIFRIGSDPGGWENRNTFKLDSLLNSLVVLTDTNELFIRNDSLFINPGFLTNAIASFDSITILNFFPLSTPPSHQEGRAWYDSTEHAFVVYNEESEVTQQLGRESYIRVYNNNGSTITNGAVVYIDSATAGFPNVFNADASDETKSAIVGVATHSIEMATNGYITNFGVVHDVNTSGFSIGDVLYLSATTPGAFTNTQPAAPNHILKVALTLTSSASGDIFVYPDIYNNADASSLFRYADSSYTLSLVQNVESRITNAGNNLYSADPAIGHGLTISGDTIRTDGRTGTFVIDTKFDFGGGSSGDYQFYYKKNSTIVSDYKGERKITNSDVGFCAFTTGVELTGSDHLTLWVINLGSSTSYIAYHSQISIEQVR